MRRITALLGALALIFTLFPAATLATPPSGTWIVTLRGGADPAEAARSLVGAHGGDVRYVYTDALRGFAFHGPQAAADAIGRSPLVTRVEADSEVRLDTTQTGATWGLDRIDQRALPLSKSYTYEATGAGVTAYVIDSGILTAHTEFEGRASLGLDLVRTNNGQDCNGHGTHVAGTIGGKTYGVAKAATLIAVRVFDCSGGSAWSTIIEGIDWVVGHHVGGPAVANMSLGGGGNQSVDDATERLIADGVSTAVAAGNGDWLGRQADACKYSPARVPAAMTISATNSSDQKAPWANYGNCVDWFAPGVSITSAWFTSTTDTKSISGTSMATPHTAGVAALYLQGNPGHSPAQVRDAIFAQTTKDLVTSSSTANNDLLYSGFIAGSGGSQPINRQPVANDVTSEGDEGTTIAWTPVVTDPDGGPLTCTIRRAPAVGTAAVRSDCTSGTYAAPLDVTSPVTFEYAVTDNGGLSDTGSVTITVHDVTDEPSVGTYSVSLADSSSNQGSTWTAVVTVLATGPDGGVNGVTVTGTWDTTAGPEDVTCTTGDVVIDGTIVAGRCEVFLSGIRKKTSSVTFTASSVSGGTATWSVPPPITVVKP